MDIVQAIALAVLQGFTEFLPISSSAHLILLPVVLGWQDQGLAFDVAVHVGTLAAVVLYYRRDLSVMVADWLGSLLGKGATDDSRLAWYVVLSTIPVGLAGLAMPHAVEEALRSPLVIAVSTIVFALLLWLSEKWAKENRDHVTLFDALLIGVFQAIALIPGTSRSGITMTGGLLTGLKREQAARFSFLLSIPVIALAGMMKTLELIKSGGEVEWGLMAIGAGLSAAIAYLTIGWFLRLLDRVGMLPFVGYRLVLGVVLFAVFVG
ncbi:MAG: undecaprenyl-diphosphate phosphatase [Methylomicrobium sp.]